MLSFIYGVCQPLFLFLVDRMQSRSVLFALCLTILALMVSLTCATEAVVSMDTHIAVDAAEDAALEFAADEEDAVLLETEAEAEEQVTQQVGSASRPNGLCDVCRYVIENKQRRQPYLCRGLKDANYQKYCVRVMESLMWWINNEVYWINYGCERLTNGAKEWVRPCPSTAICSWLQDFEIKDAFCPEDPAFPKPE